MKKIFFPFLLIVVNIGLSDAFGQAIILPEEDIAALEECEDNFLPENLDPEKAKACLDAIQADDYRLYNLLLRQDPQRLMQVTARANFLLELSHYFDRRFYYPSYYTQALMELFSDNFSDILRDFGMYGPPENVIAWVTKYFPNNTELFKRAIDEWSTLDKPTQKLISSDFDFSSENLARLELNLQGSPTKELWRQLPLNIRYGFLKEKSEKILTEMRQTSLTNLNEKLYDKLLDTGERIKRFLGQEEHDIVSSFLCALEKVFIMRMKIKDISQHPYQYELDDEEFADFKKVADAIMGAKSKPLGEQIDVIISAFGMDKLDIIFEENRDGFEYYDLNQNGANIPPHFLSSQEQLKVLDAIKPIFLEEIGGTETGNEILYFLSELYPDECLNQLDITIERAYGTCAVYNTETGMIIINSEYIDYFFKNITQGKSSIKDHIFNNDEFFQKAVRELMRDMKTTLLHEITHKRILAWRHANGFENIDVFFDTEEELLTHCTEKALNCEEALHSNQYPSEAKTFVQYGLPFMRIYVESQYPDVNTLEGARSNVMASAERALSELNARKKACGDCLEQFPPETASYDNWLYPNLDNRTNAQLEGFVESAVRWYPAYQQKLDQELGRLEKIRQRFQQAN
jgi:hypothetical protein